ncbi:MAG TPA: tRNA (adenosine(37)-N6)-threonylcarbamoyltransferase complex ATPase subunit type 1 TsaE [Candidatus Saccharimonadales bacterium]|nr:tRNA (adenosine(37)-N6)-threonylcarbamoyltransferase complex ATPase subunit type 1 TsaE [Candidatus Saccharimonadales bacterium]
MTLRTVSTSSDVTEKLGERLGSKLRGGEVIELISDLGGGKTTFVRGLAKGMGSRDKVSSPSFTISHEYTAKGHKPSKLVHFDFYRLASAGLMANELTDWLNDSDVSIIIEWAGIVKNVLPNKRLTINIKVLDKNRREFKYNYPKQLSYLVEK